MESKIPKEKICNILKYPNIYNGNYIISVYGTNIFYLYLQKNEVPNYKLGLYINDKLKFTCFSKLFNYTNFFLDSFIVKLKIFEDSKIKFENIKNINFSLINSNKFEILEFIKIEKLINNLNLEEMEYLLKNDNNINFINFLNYDDKNIKIILEIIKKKIYGNGQVNLLKTLKDDFKNISFFKKVLKSDGLCINCLESFLKNKLNEKEIYNLYLIAVKENGFSLKYIDVEKKTQELCNFAIKNNYECLNYVDKKFQTKEMVTKCVKNNGYCLSFIREDLQDKKIAYLSLNNPYYFNYIRKDLQSKILCKKAFEKLILVFANFRNKFINKINSIIALNKNFNYSNLAKSFYFFKEYQRYGTIEIVPFKVLENKNKNKNRYNIYNKII